MIHVVHVTPTISRIGGGVASYLWSFLPLGADCGLRATLVGLHDRYADQDVADNLAHKEGIRTFAAKRVGPRQFGFSPQMRRFLEHEVKDVDVVHSHGLRMLPGYEARRFARRRGVPLVISPHGQLDPWILDKRMIRKKIVGPLFDDRNQREAACIHVTADQEARYVRDSNIRTPVARVPIGLDASAYSTACDDREIIERWPEIKGKKRLLFLSTIYPKKGLPRLAAAWGRLCKDWPDWHLVVTGRELGGGRQEAEAHLAACGVMGRVTFTGPVSDEMKKTMLACGDVYVLPTDGENFGIVIAEALASGAPVITSNTTPWGDIRRYECGWWIDVGVDPLCQALTEAMGLTDSQRHAMGQRSRKLIEEKYDWDVIVPQMRRMYEWVLNRCDQPEFIYGDHDAIPD